MEPTHPHPRSRVPRTTSPMPSIPSIPSIPPDRTVREYIPSRPWRHSACVAILYCACRSWLVLPMPNGCRPTTQTQTQSVTDDHFFLHIITRPHSRFTCIPTPSRCSPAASTTTSPVLLPQRRRSKHNKRKKTQTKSPRSLAAIPPFLPANMSSSTHEKETSLPSASHVGLATTQDVERIEAPVTWKAYMICAFASFGGIFFGYDSGYINGVLGSKLFIEAVEGVGVKDLSESHTSLIVSILSCGTFFGALIAGDVADWIGRKWTVILGCLIYLIGVIIQMITGTGDPIGSIVAGRLIAGFGVGFESAIVILYMSEICPRKVRGALVGGYQFCITIGIMLASCVVYASQNRNDTGVFRIPIAIQFLWAIILAGGLMMLPDSPRYFVKKGYLPRAAEALSRLRGQPKDSEYIQVELAEIVANEEYERQLIPSTTWFGSWANCFKGSVWKANSNLRKTILGTSLQMMQQWTGVNFIFYYSTPFLKSTGAIENSFVISMIFTVINVVSTPISFWTVEKFGRRTILLWGALGMLICQFLVAIIGVTVGFNKSHPAPTAADPNATLADNISAVNAQISFICIFIFFFASTWGPGAWILIGEIFPLPIRSRGVALSTASNWLWNTIIAVITPYMVGENRGNLKSSVFFVWGGLCTFAFIYTYFLVPETKGLSLEQVDKMMEETTPAPRPSGSPIPLSLAARLATTPTPTTTPRSLLFKRLPLSQRAPFHNTNLSRRRI
ncbi:hypothetical protein B0T17DRAFT_257181 [Bombardia bombarda]|uniref:Major facilitator superfamily (MFS) profile domain-containing protein n=1 Tax=Bombardia bombarda TaxID=252184 RepID=A0AA39X0D1_9PEZI|nr:hypothetical protein B0T17DRAFT_257181 [Bombardia bombarda]